MPVVFIAVFNLEHEYAVLKLLLYLFRTLWTFLCKYCCYFCLLNPKALVSFSDTLHEAKAQKKLRITEKKNWKIFFQKLVKNIASSSRNNRDFLWCFFANWFNGCIVLLNNKNISTFILGHNDSKLNCLC